MSRPSVVALFGTFDVENYGDLLFPLLVERRLCASGRALKAFSPRGGRVDWADTIAPRPISEAADSGAGLCVIGGGNIISAAPTPLPAYASLANRLPFAYPALWLGAALAAGRNDCPLVWNAPGLPSDIRHRWGRELLQATLASSDYVSTRDAASAAWLGAVQAVNVAPDTALEVSRLWPAPELREHAESAFTSRGMNVPARWLVLHFNSRYLDGPPDQAALQAAALAAAVDAMPVLLAIGPCHGDDALVREIGSHMRIPFLPVERPAGLKEIAALIAHAAGYVGSSLHGLITSLSYRRPAIAIARTRMPKFAGFLDQIDMPERLLPSWTDSVAHVRQRLATLAPADDDRIERALVRVDDHWDRLEAAARTSRGSPRAARLALLDRSRRKPPRPWQGHAVRAMIEGGAIPCPICGNPDFVREKGSKAGARCTACLALEPERLLHQMIADLESDGFEGAQRLAFGVDAPLSSRWFGTSGSRSFEPDILDTKGEDDFGRDQDIVVVRNALERIRDYRRALRTVTGMLRPEGVALLAMEQLDRRSRTVDWGVREGAQGRYRAFGRDVEKVFAVEIPDFHVVRATWRDPVSDADTSCYLITRSSAAAGMLAFAGLALKIVQTPSALAATQDRAATGADEATLLADALRGPTLPQLGDRLRLLVERRPREARPRLLLGEWLVRSGRLEEAADCFREAVRAFPGNPWPAVRLLRLHLLRDEIAEAQGIFAARLAPGSLPQDARDAVLREIEDAKRETRSTDKPV